MNNLNSQKYIIDDLNVDAIRQELYEYISVANDNKVIALYDIVAKDANVNISWWEDEKLIEELERTDTAMDSGEEVGISWEEVKKSILNT